MSQRDLCLDAVIDKEIGGLCCRYQCQRQHDSQDEGEEVSECHNVLPFSGVHQLSFGSWSGDQRQRRRTSLERRDVVWQMTLLWPPSGRITNELRKGRNSRDAHTDPSCATAPPLARDYPPMPTPLSTFPNGGRRSDLKSTNKVNPLPPNPLPPALSPRGQLLRGFLPRKPPRRRVPAGEGRNCTRTTTNTSEILAQASPPNVGATNGET